MPSEQIITCARILKERKLTIAFAESASAGRLSSEFAMAPDSGGVLKGGIICYNAQVKQDLLGIDPLLIEEFTPESSEVTIALAYALRNLIESDIQVAVTGLTTPGGSETDKKPVGTIFVHVLFKGNSIAMHSVFNGSPEQIILQTADMIAKTVINEVEQTGNRV
ncbi:MAG TPA: nicotinamide-nucleotide amidohydrolase family protein [Dyadobacter sp.]|jgi:nicotinamide-nucleotide amidase|nr:nicotinamide-nucleotide amidohydrolase family protein [Dyadobacter sp.]